MVKFGLQLYTVRDEMEKDFFETVRKVAKIGFEGVEFAGGILQMAPAAEIRKLLEETGLKAVGAVFFMEELDHKLDDIISFCYVTSCAAVIFPWFSEKYRTAGGYRIMAKKMDYYAKILKENRIIFMYHPHGYEFDNIGSENGIEIIMKYSDPSLVLLETDVYWVESGGADSVNLCKNTGIGLHISISRT